MNQLKSTKITIDGLEQIAVESKNFIFVCAHERSPGRFQVCSTLQGDQIHLLNCLRVLFQKEPRLKNLVALAIDFDRRN